MSTVTRKYLEAPWLVFALVLAWKLVMFVVSAQPIPANDAFFYDGAVVHQLQHGGYHNPSIALALPISGTEVFSAYPPLYQGLLWMWMSVFGTSVISAIGLHLALFAAYAMVVLAILRQLRTPVWCIHIAAAFMFSMTFHDRPDSLAHVLGMLAVYAWVRSRRNLARESGDGRLSCWTWWMVVFAVLALCTSLQIGGIYFGWIWLGMISTTLAGGEEFPVTPMAVLVAMPLVLIALVKFGFPHLWDGFMEHARQTPSFTGWRVASGGELLKVARTAPGIIFIAVTLPWSWLKQHNDVELARYARFELVLIPALLSALAVVVTCLVLLTANMVGIANYAQPVIVATYLAFCGELFAGKRWLRLQIIGLWLAVALGAIRAVGMSTWGLACAADVSYPAAMHRLDAEMANPPPGAKMVVSSAFLYEASRHSDITLIHSDWMMKARTEPPPSDLRGLLTLRPRKLILTQFDFYRRYEPTLEKLRSEPSLEGMQITNMAKVRTPDSFPSLQRVVQQISWAPVIVDLTWNDGR